MDVRNRLLRISSTRPSSPSICDCACAYSGGVGHDHRAHPGDVLRAGGGHHIASLVTRPLDLDLGFAACLELQACGLAPRLEFLDLGGDIPFASVERLDLQSIEFLLLLAQVDVKLASVRVLADP